MILVGELSNASYWRAPFLSFTGAKQLAEFTVIDVELNRNTIKSKVRDLSNCKTSKNIEKY